MDASVGAGRVPPKMLFRVSLNRQSKHKILGPQHKHCGGQEAYELYTCSDVVIDVYRVDADPPAAPGVEVADPSEFDVLLATEPFSGPSTSSSTPRYEEHIVEPERRRGADGDGEEILPLERKPRRCGRVARFRSPPPGQAISIPLIINVVSFKHNNVLYRIVVCGDAVAEGRTVRRLYGVLDRPIRSVSKEIKRKGGGAAEGGTSLPRPLPLPATSGLGAEEEAVDARGGKRGARPAGPDPPELHPVSSASSASSSPAPSALAPPPGEEAPAPRRNARRATAIAGMRRVRGWAEAQGGGEAAEGAPEGGSSEGDPARDGPADASEEDEEDAAHPGRAGRPRAPRPAKGAGEGRRADRRPDGAAKADERVDGGPDGLALHERLRQLECAVAGRDAAIAHLELERHRSIATFADEIERRHRASLASEGRRRELEERLEESAEEVRQLREMHAGELRRNDRLRSELAASKDELRLLQQKLACDGAGHGAAPDPPPAEGPGRGKRKEAPGEEQAGSTHEDGLLLLSAFAARQEPDAPAAGPPAPA